MPQAKPLKVNSYALHMHLKDFVVVLQCLVTWQGDILVCTQEGEKVNRGWRHWIEGDRLYLVR